MLFAGDLCFFGVTPLAFQGDPATWAEMLDSLPGAGVDGSCPATARSAASEKSASSRRISGTASQGRSRPARGTRWPEREPRDAINIQRAQLLAAGRDEMPPAMLPALGFG